MASERGKAIYRSLAELIGGRPSVHRWESDNFPGMSVDILQGSGWPAPSDRVAATLNLSNEPGVDAYELILRSHERWDVEQVLGDVGIRVRRDVFSPAHGATVMHGMMPTYEDLVVRHLLAVRVDSLGLPLVPPRVEPPMVFLALLPLTDVELAWVESVGPEPFLIASAAIDLLDFGRQGIGPV